MAKTLTAQSFDYSGFDRDTKSKLVWYAGDIIRQSKSHLETGLEMGRMLTEARALCGEKSFKAWVESECGCSVRTAYNYMAAHREFGECATVAHIELGAMYELTKSDRAKKKALKLADRGVKVTQSMAKKLIEEARSDLGKPGGSHPTPIGTPVSDGPASSETAAETPELGSRDEGSPDSRSQTGTPGSPAIQEKGEDVSLATESAQETAPETPRNGTERTDAPGEDLARKNRTLAHSYRDKLARAICDYHEVCPNRKERDRLVSLVQSVELWA